MPVTLKKGDVGMLVERLQRELLAVDAVKYHLGSAGADGKFGNATTAAVRKFQADHSLNPTGVADSATIAALYLDAETLESTIIIDDDPDAGLPGVIADRSPREVIKDLVDAMKDGRVEFANALERALDRFQNFMASPTQADTQSRALQVYMGSLSDAYAKSALKAALKSVPLLGDGIVNIYDAYKKGEDEIARAKAASELVGLRDFKDARLWALGNLTATFREDLVVQNLVEQYNRSASKSQFLAVCAATETAMQTETAARHEEWTHAHTLELCERWINAHFRGIPTVERDDPATHGAGFVDLIATTDSSSPPSHIWKLTDFSVRVPFGKQVSELMQTVARWEQHNPQRRLRPATGGGKAFITRLKVPRRVALGSKHTNFTVIPPSGAIGEVADFVQKLEWTTHAAWLDPDGKVIRAPTHPDAQQALARFMGSAPTFVDGPGSLLSTN